MAKLISKYLAEPTESNLLALKRYLYKHPFATCTATATEIEFLRSHNLY